MQAGVYTRERKHIGSIWYRVTYLALPFVAAQSHVRRALKDFQSRRRLMIATGNKYYKQINKQYTKQYQMTKQTVPTDATRRYKQVSTRIIQIGAKVKKL
jgi:hypothetical protein